MEFCNLYCTYENLLLYLFSGIDSITLNKSSVTTTMGEDVVVDFTYSANPQPTISVDKAGSADSGVDLLTNSQFGFDDVTSTDTGSYDVEAVNFAGSAQANFTLTVMQDGESELHNAYIYIILYIYIYSNNIYIIFIHSQLYIYV